MEEKTLTETMLEYRESEHLKKTRENLSIVLDFVERWNKKDHETDVAKAAQYLSALIT